MDGGALGPNLKKKYSATLHALEINQLEWQVNFLTYYTSIICSENFYRIWICLNSLLYGNVTFNWHDLFFLYCI